MTEVPTDATGGPLPPPAPAGIQWGLFFRAASPLAALTGLLCFLFSPLAMLIVLPLSLRRTLGRYRPYHGGPLTPGHGARLGAFMGVLSFAAFLIFFLATIPINRQALLEKFREQAGQYSDPRSQQLISWLATNQGFAVLALSGLVFVLLLFSAIGAISGAMMPPPRSRA